MREILFRGKTLDKGEWVYGNLITDDNDVYILTQENLSRGIDIGGWIDGVQSCEVIPETVGQYTGLRDKNGERIFEGDIIKSIAAWYVVEFENGGYGLSPFGKGKLIPIMGHWNFNGNEVEVIGNIHDNPELLEGE